MNTGQLRLCPEFWGALSPYVQVIRSNQTTSNQKREAIQACYALAHSSYPDKLPDLWELLSTLSQATGDAHG